MTTGRNFDLYAGGSATIYFKIATSRNGVVTNIDLTNKTLLFKLSILENDEFVLVKDSTVNGGITITDEDAGEFEVYLEPGDTETFSEENKTKKLKWVLSLEYDEIVKKIQQGIITLIPAN